MKKFCFYVFFLCFLPEASSQEALRPKEITSDSCYAFIYQGRIAAFFPVAAFGLFFEWFEIPGNENEMEYMWIIEPGRLRENSFSSDGIAMSFNVGSLNIKNNPKKTEI